MTLSRLLIGLGAGLVSALLLATIATASPIAFLLVALSPLPLVLVGLGWTWMAAIVGSVVASAGLAIVTAPPVGLVYFLGIGAPAAGLSYVALLGRPATESGDPAVQRSGGMEWYPVGRIVAWLAVVAALLATVFVLQFGFSLDAYLAGTRQSTEESLRLLGRMGLFEVPSPGPALDRLVRAMALSVPVVMAGFLFLALVFNTWLGGRIVERSGRSPRPWPDVPALVLPRPFAVATLAAYGIALVGPDLLSPIAGFFATTFTLAYTLQGLAVLHYVTRGVPARGLALATVYVVLAVFSGLALLVAVLGLAEPMLRLRARTDARRAPPPTT